jgi:hypothetical protein
VRLYVWAHGKRKNKTLKTKVEQVQWAASFLRGDAYARFKPYLTHYLGKRGTSGATMLSNNVEQQLLPLILTACRGHSGVYKYKSTFRASKVVMVCLSAPASTL